MKSIYTKTTASILAVMCMLSSCKTVDKFTVQGKPGTQLYSPSEVSVGVIPESGKLELEIPSSTYYPFMLAKEPGSDLMVPFGLDVRNRSRKGEAFVAGLGWTLTAIGTVGYIAGIAIIAPENVSDDLLPIGGAMAGIGGGLLFGGLSMGATASSKLSQTTHKYQFTYVDDQHIINTDILKPLSNPGPGKSANPAASKQQKPKASIANMAAKPVADPTEGMKAKKSFTDLAQQISKTYKCSGSLMLNGNAVETYPEVIVTLAKVDKNMVDVAVSIDGEDFFGAAYSYRVAKQADGSYLLTMQGLDSASITITADGVLNYSNSAVNIDGDLYTLSATSAL